MRELDLIFDREMSEFAISYLTRRADLTIDVRVVEIVKSSLFVFVLIVIRDIYD